MKQLLLFQGPVSSRSGYGDQMNFILWANLILE